MAGVSHCGRCVQSGTQVLRIYYTLFNRLVTYCPRSMFLRLNFKGYIFKSNVLFKILLSHVDGWIDKEWFRNIFCKI